MPLALARCMLASAIDPTQDRRAKHMFESRVLEPVVT